jgi:hypothetical protein
MFSSNSRFSLFSERLSLILLWPLLFYCQDLWASQRAIVITDKAVIYADETMTSPIGYLSKGKSFLMGEIPRNKAQVYPIIVSGKVAYIRAIDVSTDFNLNQGEVALDRFARATDPHIVNVYSLLLYQYRSDIAVSRSNGGIGKNDTINWGGVSFKGSAQMWKRTDLEVYVNLSQVKTDRAISEEFRVVEFGLGYGVNVIRTKRLTFKLSGQAYAIPYTSYGLEDKFRVNGFGGTLGGSGTLSYRFTKHWGLEAFGGYYVSRLFNYKAPTPYSNIVPFLSGPRIGAGINFQY